MSATLKNLPDLAEFLNAHLYTSCFRPVDLIQYVKIENVIYKINDEKLKKLKLEGDDVYINDVMQFDHKIWPPYTKEMEARDPDHIVSLAMETLSQTTDCSKFKSKSSFENEPVFKVKTASLLIFCPTKSHCESTAKLLAENIPSELCTPKEDAELLDARRNLLLKNLRLDNKRSNVKDEEIDNSVDSQKSGSCCPVLERTVPKGIAYHHSGLTQEERKALEEAYHDGVLRVLCCTSTLAAGVNLPARRVIIRKPYVGSECISWSQYNQMIGRAGRAGLDTHGESIVILRTDYERSLFARLVGLPQSSEENVVTNLCKSNLMESGGKNFRSFLLSLISLKLATSFMELVDVLKSTFFGFQQRAVGFDDTFFIQLVKENISHLIKNNLISSDVIKDDLDDELSDLNFKASQMGRAAVVGGLDIQEISYILQSLRIAARQLNTTGPLHLLYLIIPKDFIDQMKLVNNLIDWNFFYSRITILHEEEQNILRLIGFSESYFVRKISCSRIQKVDETPLYRLYVALALRDIWPSSAAGNFGDVLMNVSIKYKITRGNLQSLLTSSSSLAIGLGNAIVKEYSEDPEIWAFAHLLPIFAKKIAFCVNSDLLPLMELPGIKHARAKKLFERGFKSIGDIAVAHPREIFSALSPYLKYKNAKSIVEAAQMIIVDTVDNKQCEATELLNLLRSTRFVKDINAGEDDDEDNVDLFAD